MRLRYIVNQKVQLIIERHTSKLLQPFTSWSNLYLTIVLINTSHLNGRNDNNIRIIIKCQIKFVILKSVKTIQEFHHIFG